MRTPRVGSIVSPAVPTNLQYFFLPIAGIFFLCGIVGCQRPAHPTRLTPTTFQVNAIVKPGDPVPHPIYLVQLDTYQIDVPFGSVSQNKTFWTHLDQGDIPSQTYSLLLRNGFHLGAGRITDWDFFRDILEKNPAHTRVTSRLAYQEQHEPLLTRTDQPPSNLFYFDSTGQLVGRSFGQADDELLLSFWPTPRHNGQIHIQLLPGVRSKQELQPQWVNGVETINNVRPEFFYDLKLEADLDVDHFLLLAPSGEARLASSLGDVFLVDHTAGARTEAILIFVARPIGAHALMPASH